MTERLIGLLLGTEDDWPTAFEALVSRLGPVDGHVLRTERIRNEPFDLRSTPRYALVIDRLAWWYDLPRAWLKKISLMDDVYLLNNPFTFQAMEKHSAYCALMRLGIRVPETWLIPHKVPPENPRFPGTAERYNAPFELDGDRKRHRLPALHEALRRRPVGGRLTGGLARRAAGALRRVGPADDAPADGARGLRRLRPQPLDRRRDDVDVVRPLAADVRPLPGAPRLPDAALGDEIVTISRLVNAFFRWEFNSCETIVKDGVAYPIDYANASPDVALTSLHYYFPWAITALVRWSAFCAVTRREMLINQNSRDYFAWGDRDDLSYEEKLAEYRKLADAYFQVDAYREFCDRHLAHLDELAQAWFTSSDFDGLIVRTVQETFPAHERERFVAHYRGLLAAWARDSGC